MPFTLMPGGGHRYIFRQVPSPHLPSTARGNFTNHFTPSLNKTGMKKIELLPKKKKANNNQPEVTSSAIDWMNATGRGRH